MDTVICFGNYIFCCSFKLAILARHQKDSLRYYHNTQILSSSQDRKLWRCNLECMIFRPYQRSGARRGGSKDLNPDPTKQKGARDLCLSSPVSFRKRNTCLRGGKTLKDIRQNSFVPRGLSVFIWIKYFLYSWSTQKDSDGITRQKTVIWKRNKNFHVQLPFSEKLLKWLPKTYF